jgi:protein-S-isoprenylcysteine O-methyltransferase Ste14
VPNPRTRSIAGFVALVLAIVFLFHEHQLFATSSTLIAVQIAAVPLMLWARVTLGMRSFHAAADPTEGGLIKTGPYGFIRHPIYASILLFLAAAASCYHKWISLAALAIAIAGALLRITAEEQLLREKYAGYAGYARRTKRLVPFVY